MSMSKKSGHAGRYRADELPVRRWLQLGVASAGMGAALIGWSLVGSEVGVASADSGVESSASAPSLSGRAGVAGSPADAKSPSTTSRKVNPTVVSRSNRGAADVNSQATSRGGAPKTKPSIAAQPAAAPGGSVRPHAVVAAAMQPAATTNGGPVRMLANPGTQLSGGGGAGSVPVVTAGVRDGLGAAAKLLGQGIKDALSSRPLQNYLQNQGPNLPGLLDLIPKTRYTVNDPLRNAIKQAQDAEDKRRQDAKTRQINEIVEKGVKLTASDGSPVYTVDGEHFVKYEVASFSVYGNKVTEHPRTPRLVTIRPGPNADRNIRSILMVDPAAVRNLLPKQPSPVLSPFSGSTFSWSHKPTMYILVGGATNGFGRSRF